METRLWFGMEEKKGNPYLQVFYDSCERLSAHAASMKSIPVGTYKRVQF